MSYVIEMIDENNDSKSLQVDTNFYTITNDRERVLNLDEKGIERLIGKDNSVIVAEKDTKKINVYSV